MPAETEASRSDHHAPRLSFERSGRDGGAPTSDYREKSRAGMP